MTTAVRLRVATAVWAGGARKMRLSPFLTGNWYARPEWGSYFKFSTSFSEPCR